MHSSGSTGQSNAEEAWEVGENKDGQDQEARGARIINVSEFQLGNFFLLQVF